ncbi:MAG: polysaccharide biosynthesis tyrosine autokinase [Clostridia bacterium]|nr:polysaccharide biosynthesis tyrosine autokinase [Clostridia bacterium]
MEEIDLKSLFNLIWKKKIAIICITILGALIAVGYNLYFTVPKYKSTTTFLLTQSADEQNVSNTITTTDITLNSKLLNNYTELIKSDSVLNEVLKRLEIVYNTQELKKNISIVSKSDTFIVLSVEFPQKEKAPLIANTIVEVFNEKVKEIYNMENVHVMDLAVEANKPSNINPIKYSIIGAGIGFIISIMIVLIFNCFDDSVKDENDIERQLGLKTLAKISKQQKIKKIEWNPKADYIEGIKALRTNLQFVKRGKDIKTVAITSTCPGEGKSWIASNLALAFAKADYNVCVVDTDMRKGTIHNKFGISQTPGLSNLIISDDDVEDFKMLYNKYIKSTKINNISVISCGNYSTDSSELLISNKVKKLIYVLKQYFDIIIFDTAPSTLLTDAIILSRLVDTNIIVTEYGKTKFKELKNVKDLINSVEGDLAGVVINKIDDNKRKDYYYGETKKVKKRRH